MNQVKYIALLLGMTMVVHVACNRKEENKNKATTERIEKVEVMTLGKETIARQLELASTLEGYEEMKVAPSIAGNIEHIYVDVGTQVSKGQMLVRLDQNQLNTAKINLSTVETEFDRVKALLESGSASQQSYDQLKGQLDQLKQNISFLEQNTFVKAQFAGVISAKNYEDGEMFSPQLPIFTLTQIQTLKAFVNVPETFYPLVKEGMKVAVHSDIYPDKEFTAVVETVFPTIDPRSHTFQVKLKLTNPKQLLRPGMFTRSVLSLGQTQAVLVPYQAILKTQGANDRYVFVNQNGVAKRVEVTIGQRFDDKVEIISDQIKEGDQLIVTGQARLVEGVKLEIVTRLNTPQEEIMSNH